MSTIDPIQYEFLGTIELGFYRHRENNKMLLNIKPNPANREDQAAMATMALYVASIREAIKSINKNLEQAQLIQKLRQLPGATKEEADGIQNGEEPKSKG